MNAKCDYCDQRATTLAGDTNGVLVCEDHVRLFAEREIAAAIDHAERYPGYEKHKRHMLTSPPAVAASTGTSEDVEALVEALTYDEPKPLDDQFHEGCREIARAVLASDWLRDLLAEAKADAWELGWEACANYVQDGDADPKVWDLFHVNPYRETGNGADS